MNRCTLALLTLAWLFAGCEPRIEPATSFASSIPSIAVSALQVLPRPTEVPIVAPKPPVLDLSTVPAAELDQLSELVTTVLGLLQQRRYAALTSVVHPERGLTIEDKWNHIPRKDLPRFVASAAHTIEVNCHDGGITFGDYVDKVTLRGLDYTDPRPIHYDRVRLRDAATDMEGKLPRVVVEVTDRENELGWVHQVVLYVDKYDGQWYLAGIYTTDHHACG